MPFSFLAVEVVVVIIVIEKVVEVVVVVIIIVLVVVNWRRLEERTLCTIRSYFPQKSNALGVLRGVLIFAPFSHILIRRCTTKGCAMLAHL